MDRTPPIGDPTVNGESARLIFNSLFQMKREPATNGMASMTLTLPPDELAPLHRALMRIEAELLIEDAGEWVDGNAGERTDDQRRFDAFQILTHRTCEAMGTG